MQRPPTITLDDLVNLQRANEALTSAKMTTNEKSSILLHPHTEFCRDLEALDEAGVVILTEIIRPKFADHMAADGPYLYGDWWHTNWIATKLCCAGSGLSLELMNSAIVAGAVIDIHVLPFAVERSNPNSSSALRKLQNLYKSSSLPPCNRAIDDWLTYLAQKADGPLFVLCAGKAYWKQRPFFEEAAQRGRLIQRSAAVMQQHNRIDQGWKLSPSYYTHEDLVRIKSAITATRDRLQQQGDNRPAPALPPTAAYPVRLQLRG